MFRYSKFSGFLKQMPFLRAGVSTITWLWKWMGKFTFCFLLGERNCNPFPSSHHLLSYSVSSPFPLHLCKFRITSVSVPGAVGNCFCCGYACSSWAAYASLIKAFLLIIKLVLGYYVHWRCILICLEAVNILKTTRFITGFQQLSHVYTNDKVTLEESVSCRNFPSSEALDCTVTYVIKLKQFYYQGLWLEHSKVQIFHGTCKCHWIWWKHIHQEM